ncbi:hypothetical protein K0M31_016757 [Melipona bicolor]|uniref:Uncharacterized protein n=1 Tax=Melipona bicolor TaxID=60889 RepID=A0AA40FEB1_9HYME|nr:hypothetical protein K0M31_016757 [Melipona bicolor]
MNSRREPLPDIDDAYHANNSNIIELTMITPEARDHNDAGGSLAANYGKQQQQDDYITSDNEVLGSSHYIEIPQTPHLLNQTSHENNVTAETDHIHNSLPGFDSKKLKYQANNTLSSLLLEYYGEYRSKNISEQNDSEIHVVTSSESTSPYDESPRKKGTLATENQQQAHCLDGEENASYSCSNLGSPKSSTTSDSSCVYNLTNAKTVASLDHSIRVHDPHAKKYIPRISSTFNGANEEFFGAAYVRSLSTTPQSVQLPNQLHAE